MLLISQQRGYSKIPSLTKSHPILSVYCPLIIPSAVPPNFLFVWRVILQLFRPGLAHPKWGRAPTPIDRQEVPLIFYFVCVYVGVVHSLAG